MTRETRNQHTLADVWEDQLDVLGTVAPHDDADDELTFRVRNEVRAFLSRHAELLSPRREP